jgi:hypothetical protein
MSDFALHFTADMIGEADSLLSRMRSTGCAGASHIARDGRSAGRAMARVLDNGDPLAKLAAKR